MQLASFEWQAYLVNDHEPHGQAHGGGHMQNAVNIVVLGDQLGPGQVDSDGVRHGKKDGVDPSAEIGCHIPVTAPPVFLSGCNP